MSSEENKAIVRRIVEEVWNRTNLGAADQLFAPSFSRDEQVLGPEGVKAIIRGLAAAYPDLHYTIDDLIAEGDRVVLCRTMRFTHSGAMQHPVFGLVPPTGKTVAVRGINVFRLAGGKATQVFELGDAAGFARQLGLRPVLVAAEA